MGRERNMLRAGEWKATTEGTREKIWTHRRDKVPVVGRGEEERWASMEYILCPSMCACLPASREKSFPDHPLFPSPCMPGQKPPAILVDWLHHLCEANHHRSFPWPGLPIHRKCPIPVRQACQHCLPSGGAPLPWSETASPAHPWELPDSSRARRPVLIPTPEVLLCLGVTLLATLTLGKCPTASKQEGQHLPISGKLSTAAPGKACLAMGSAPPPQKRKTQARRRSSETISS